MNTYWGPSFMMLCGGFFKDHFRLAKTGAYDKIHAYIHQGYIYILLRALD